MSENEAVDSMLIEWEDAQRQAYDALGRYKFWMFGYHAARVVFLASLINRIGGPRLSNPFRRLVDEARKAYCGNCGELAAPEHRCTSESLTWATAKPEQLLLDEAPGAVNEISDGGPQ